MLIVQNLLDCCSVSAGIGILDVIGTVINILAAILGGFCAVKGLRYLEVLRKKRTSAAFSFWIQLRVRIEELRSALVSDNSIVNGLYSDKTRTEWSNTGICASDIVVERFYGDAQETLQFVKNVSDQIPINKEWLNAYTKATPHKGRAR